MQCQSGEEVGVDVGVVEVKERPRLCVDTAVAGRYFAIREFRVARRPESYAVPIAGNAWFHVPPGGELDAIVRSTAGMQASPRPIYDQLA